MLGVLKRNPFSVMLALLLHFVIVFFLVFGVDWEKKPKPIASQANVVQAHTIDLDKINEKKAEEKKAQQLKQQQQEKKRRQAEEKKRQQAL
ncbi:MAG: hypothetical protein JAY69_14945, partial [Candidatus Thiodiazotropha taylori]|nr:hypothetical protein [Candidatus Thiodiazotropha taylori]MCW4233921.1 hypothetical protein [Candidatus Thiodiazotropha taylori]